MKFAPQTRSDPRCYANTGERIKTTYVGRYNDRGQLVLEESGTEDLYAYIQSFKESTDLKTIIARYTNGETDVLSKVQGFYADVSEMPGTYADMLQIVTNGEQTFNDLPVDIRAKFSHNFGEFLAEFGTPEFFEKLGVKAERLTADKPADVSETAIPADSKGE